MALSAWRIALPLALLASLMGAVGAADAPDPNAYLEAVRGPRALETVKRWNAATRKTLSAEPHFAEYRARALALLQDEQQIAAPDAVIGDRVLNLWQDKANPRGLWRIASLESFAAGKPAWRVLIDVDALGKAEGRSWVWKGAVCRAPDYRRCMVALSDGGGDAVVQREYDVEAGAFVPGGFVVPSAKSSVAWAGPDALYVAADFGPGSLTRASYPRMVRLWRRGTPMHDARLIAEGRETDNGLAVVARRDGDATYTLLLREIDTYSIAVSHILPDGRLVASPLPADAEVQDVLDGRLIAKVLTPWRGYPAGSLVAYAIADVLAGRPPAVEEVFRPTARQSVEEVRASRSLLWVKLLDDVSGKLLAVRRGEDGRWRDEAIPLAANATVHLEVAAGRRDLAFATVEGMLLPPTLYAITPDAAPVAVQALPARFDAAKMAVTQRFATSKDGTRIPYFLVRRKDVAGPVPVLVHAYGGFRVAQTPVYLVDEPYRSGPAALFWVEEGNAYVLANIRGGSEYGPAWHDAALREKRQNAFDDFHAVAEDLIRTGVSEKGRIAASGRSNGGLLVGVLMEQRPDLYGAIVMGSPLLDMKRYSHLLAGASWIGEYGDPDKPADWAFIRRYSPYQNLKRGVHYPAPFIYTSTEDDRVHPGHARTFAARLEAFGDRFYYDETLEGGHAAGADRLADADRAALVTVYLNKELGVSGK